MASIQMRSVRTRLKDPVASAEDLLTQLGDITPKLVVLFASRERDHLTLNRALRDRLPKDSRLIGATTAGEIDNAGMHSETAVLGALTGDFDVGVGIGRRLSVDAMSAGETAVKMACEGLGVRPKDINSHKYVGAVIDDGYQFKKEEFLLGMMDQNQDLILVGGGAADHENDPARQSALIHVDGEVTDDAVLIALFHTEAPWAALRSHWYHPTGETLRITKVDSSQMRALEIDGQPAAKRYAEILGVNIDDLEFGKPRGFATRPTALKVGREYFLRSPWKPLEDGSILFPSLLEEGSELEIMEIGDIAALTREFFVKELPQRVESPKAALFFHCEARKWFAASTGKLDDLAATFQAAPPCVGMNVSFEIYCGFHINTTLTTLIFGANE
jgi:hypothetical protein